MTTGSTNSDLTIETTPLIENDFPEGFKQIDEFPNYGINEHGKIYSRKLKKFVVQRAKTVQLSNKDKYATRSVKKLLEKYWPPTLEFPEGFKQIDDLPNYGINEKGEIYNKKQKVFVVVTNMRVHLIVNDRSTTRSVKKLLAKYWPNVDNKTNDNTTNSFHDESTEQSYDESSDNKDDDEQLDDNTTEQSDDEQLDDESDWMDDFKQMDENDIYYIDEFGKIYNTKLKRFITQNGPGVQLVINGKYTTRSAKKLLEKYWPKINKPKDPNEIMPIYDFPKYGIKCNGDVVNMQTKKVKTQRKGCVRLNKRELSVKKLLAYYWK